MRNLVATLADITMQRVGFMILLFHYSDIFFASK
jgi:hypothetical protein